MSIKFDVTDEWVNSQFGPVAALAAYYESQKVLEPLELVIPAVVKSDYDLANQLTQILLSILTGCEYISLVNTRLRPEQKLAQVYRKKGFAHQATLARSLDALSQTNLNQLAQAVGAISAGASRTRTHDWRGYLLLDCDLSGLPCGKQAQGSRKGYFSGKKTPLADN